VQARIAVKYLLHQDALITLD